VVALLLRARWVLPFVADARADCVRRPVREEELVLLLFKPPLGRMENGFEEVRRDLPADRDFVFVGIVYFVLFPIAAAQRPSSNDGR